jgi:ectoine hydroxylase-related dioxygenase (phytanoyl-CoA dioxygenase family)
MPAAEISSIVADYRRDGYAVLPNVVPTPLLDAAEAVLDDREHSWERQLQRLPAGRSWISHAGEVTFTARLAGTEPILRRLLACDALVQFRDSVVGPSVRLYFDQAVYKKAGCEQVVPWHQDDGYNPKIPSDYVTFWLAVTDTTVANGTIRFQPGRHREGPRPHWRTSGGYLVCEAGADGGVAVELQRGDVVAFSSLLPHATGPNTTAHIRKAYIATCVPDGTRLVNGTVCNDPVDQPLLAASGA